MPIIDPFDDFYSLGIQRRFTRPVEFGQLVCGWSQFGDEDYRFGVYQKRVRRGNFWTNSLKIKKGFGYCKMKYYMTANPKTVSQQANRNKFGDAVRAWQNLTDDQKSVYNKLATRENKSGFNIFIAEWVKSH